MVGTGGIARAHLRAYRELAEEVEVVAAVDVNDEAVRAFCAEAGPQARPHTSLDAMLAEAAPDLVSVCTPPTLHASQTTAALRAGAWVLCEKPPCPSLEEYDGVTAAESEGGPYASIVFQQRFASATAHVKRLLETRAMGRPLVAHCQTTWYRNAAYYQVPWRGKWATEGGGPAMGHGIHQMDLLLELLGPWSEIRAAAGRRLHTGLETEDVTTALVTFADGTMATVVNSVVSPDEVSRIRIDCEHATVELTHLYSHRNENWTITPSKDVDAERAKPWQDFGPDVPASHGAQLRHLIASIRAGERPRSSGADGRGSLELIAGIYKSAFTDRTVRAGEIGPGDPFYRAMHGDAEGWAPAAPARGAGAAAEETA